MTTEEIPDKRLQIEIDLPPLFVAGENGHAGAGIPNALREILHKVAASSRGESLTENDSYTHEIRGTALELALRKLDILVKPMIEHVRDLEDELHDGVDLRTACSDGKRLGEVMCNEGPESWAKRGAHPRIAEAIIEHQTIAHEIREVRAELDDALTVLQRRAFRGDEQNDVESDPYRFLMAFMEELESIDALYLINLERLAELRFYQRHALYVANGAAVVEVLSERQMNQAYPEFAGWVNPVRTGWPVVHYRVDYETVKWNGGAPSVFDTVRACWELADCDDPETSAWGYPGDLAALDNPYATSRMTDAEISSVSRAGGLLRHERIVATDDMRYFEKRAMILPHGPLARRNFFLSAVGLYEGEARSPESSSGYCSLLVKGRLPASRLQIFDPEVVKLLERDAEGRPIDDGAGGYRFRTLAERQPRRSDEHRVRIVQRTEGLDIPGYEAVVTTLQRVIARELFVPMREQWDNELFEPARYAIKWSELSDRVHDRRREVAHALMKEWERTRTAASLGDLERASRSAAFEHAQSQFDILERELLALHPERVALLFQSRLN